MMQSETRQILLRHARQHFAEKGFYGASLSAIARDVGITKQSLLHHFGSKEKLYATILHGISDQMMARLDAIEQQYADPAARFEAAILDHVAHDADSRQTAQILMRELLDVERRANDVRSWVLKAWLDRLTGMLQQATREKNPDTAIARAELYHLLGSISYFSVSHIVLHKLYGQDSQLQMEADIPAIIKRHIRALTDDG